MNNISQENNSTIVFPVPIDIISEMVKGDNRPKVKYFSSINVTETFISYSPIYHPSPAKATNKFEKIPS